MKFKLNPKVKKLLIPIYKPIYGFFNHYLLNRIVPFIPFWTLRKAYYRLMGVKFGHHCFIDQSVYILRPSGLKLGDFVHINQGCFLDARAPEGIKIGNNVSVSHYTKIVTGGHDWNSPLFEGKFLPIKINDYVWIGINCIIMQGLELGEGCVIGSGAVVTKDTMPYSLYVGNPAKKIKERNKNLTYHPLEHDNHFRFL